MAERTARASDADPRAGWVGATVSATSSLDNKHGAGMVVDEEPLTAWCTAEDAAPSEELTIQFGAPVDLDTVTFSAGLYSSKSELSNGKVSKKWNQPTKLTIIADNGEPVTLKVKGDHAWFNPSKPLSQLRISFAAVKKGKRRASCLNGISIMTKSAKANGRNEILFTTDVKSAASLSADFDALGKAVKSCDPSALQRVVQFPFDDAESNDGVRWTHESYDVADFDADMCQWLAEKHAQQRTGGQFGTHCMPIGIDQLSCFGEIELRFQWSGKVWKLTAARKDSSTEVGD